MASPPTFTCTFKEQCQRVLFKLRLSVLKLKSLLACENMQLLFLGTLALFAGLSVAVPAQEKRIHHKLDLSDHPHDDAHGFQFDHEAFLGKEESKTFDQLSLLYFFYIFPMQKDCG